MKLARFRTLSGDVYAGTVTEDSVLPLLPGDGYAGREALIDLAMGAHGSLRGLAALPLAEVKVLGPVPYPGSIRDFYSFEAHVSTARGGKVPEAWYEQPVFYFSNPATILGPFEDVKHPTTEALDYELEVAAIVGRDLVNATADEALGAIAGYTIFNDWSARDLQKTEMSVGLGPAKGKDFASSFGPYLVTPDELGSAMVARVNGVEYSRGSMLDLHWSFAEMISYASRDSRVRRADIIGSGTVGTGCILELRASREVPWLAPGDVVELAVDGLGVLRNRIV